MIDWKSTAAYIERQVSNATDQAFYNMLNVPSIAVHIYYKRGSSFDEPDTGLSAYPEDVARHPDNGFGPDGWQLAVSERCPRGLTKEQLRAWIRERINSVPFLPST